MTVFTALTNLLYK